VRAVAEEIARVSEALLDEQGADTPA